MLRQILPDCVIVLGGPEVSFETDESAYPFADYIIQGAGEHVFADLIKDLMKGRAPQSRIIKSCAAPALAELPSPYTSAYYNSFGTGRMASVANQLVYYESSRGCPFSCTYCLSATACGISELPLAQVLSDLDDLTAHGATCIKFVDRTFNANKGRALEILQHILTLETDCTFHFEAAADLFDSDLLQVISAMPSERVQFEIGIQSIHAQTLIEINRHMDLERVFQNIQTLVSFGNCHIHVDLIAGLPFETPDSFSKGIDACIKLRPHMLQLGFLKLLKGTTIRTHRERYGYVFNEFPPYEVLQSKHMRFADMIQLRRVEEMIDRFYNKGIFANSVNYAINHIFGSAYPFFEALSAFCEGDNPRVSPKHAYTMLFRFLCAHIDRGLAEHYIKLDACTFNTKNVLPDEITVCRDKRLEETVRKSVQPWYANLRVEHFPHDGKTRAFVYDRRDGVSGAYQVIEL